ncbi:MAG TPA: dienelactone hydrolase family protein [Bryobacteraceae bacterium]|nr:dienelactone hydrolase family protein [Bryobacteraceae bacterium]
MHAGFARAVLPVAASAIATGAEGLDAAETRIPTADGEIPAYYARPAAGGAFPAVLVVHEIFGVDEHIRDVCRRLAHAGYFAVAPELFARLGDISGIADIQELIKLVSRVPDAQVLSDLDAAAAWATGTGKADPARLAITGFCWGGRIAWLYAAHNPRLQAAAAWYGRLTGPTDALHPRHPVDVAGSLHAPVLGLYGGQDQSIPLDTVERMRAALQQAGAASEIVLYPDAGHAFHADYRPSYHAAAAQDGWKRMLAWFAR